jgi:DNA-binding MurR/RpiR family transcriptional regulator
VLFLGLRACLSIAFLLHYTYGLLRANGTLVTDTAGTLADQMAQADRETVLVSVSMAPYTRQTVEATAAARRHGAQVVALTDAVLSPIARGAEHVLLFEAATNSFLHSKTGAVALAEALIAAVTARGGEPVIERLRRMQHHLRSSHAYWERSHRRHAE